MFEDDKPFRIRDRQALPPALRQGPYLDESKDWFHEGYADRPLDQGVVEQVSPAEFRANRRLETEARRQLLPERHRTAAEEVG